MARATLDRQSETLINGALEIGLLLTPGFGSE
jgi:hypothetical protein